MQLSGLSFTEHAPTEAQTEGGGDNEILVALVHGSMDRATSFRRVVERLTDFRVLTYDRRGYAKSRMAGPAPRSIAGQADDLLQLLAGRPAVVAGHSFGGDIALAASLLAPGQVCAVVAYEPPMPWLPWWPNDSAGRAALAASGEGGPELAAETFMRRMVGNEVWERLPQTTRNARRAEGPALLADMACLHPAPADGDPLDPSLVTVPVVLGVGTKSRPHYRENALRLPVLIARSELVEVEGSGHGCHISHPDKFGAMVRRAVAVAELSTQPDCSAARESRSWRSRFMS